MSCLQGNQTATETLRDFMTTWLESTGCERIKLPTSLHFLMIPFRASEDAH